MINKSFISTVILITSFICTFAAQKSVMPHDFTPIQKLGYAERIIENFYVDSVNLNDMVEEGIIAMLKTLDPHSTYTDARETQDLTTPLQGNFSGIGIQFNMLNDTLYVIQTTVGGPSEKVGILPGDRILQANDSVLSGVKRKNSDIINILRGPKGSRVEVKVLRRNVSNPITFDIVRDDIPIYSIDASYAVDSITGYVRVSRFAETTAHEVEEVIKNFRKNGIENLIIDLTDNGGGYLNSAVDMASLFLPKGSLIVYTDGPRVERTEYVASKDPIMPDGKLIVLVNQYSASSSEIFAGAIQDHDRGIIVGRRTFGKGLVQRPFPFPDGSMIRLTVSKYYTPSGRSIQKPYENGSLDKYYMDLYNRYKNGEFVNADSIHYESELRVNTLRTNRPVYGGGGITPDIFVAIDTVGYTKLYRELTAKGLINSTAMSYVDLHRQDIMDNYPSIELFINDFSVGDDIMNNLVKNAKEQGVDVSDDELNESSELLKVLFKGIIARDLWDMSAYFQAVNPAINAIYNNGVAITGDDVRYNSLLGEN